MTNNKYNSTDEYETVNGVKLYLLSTEEASSLPVNVRKAGFTGGNCYDNEWWLRSPGVMDGNESVAAAFVYGKNFDMGNTRNAMTTVTYTAKTGYEFPETSESDLYKTTNGITVTRTSDTVITVSGTPTAAVTSITVPDAVQSSIAVTGVSLDKTTAQSITVGNSVAFTAIVAPDNATDKTVKWSVGGTDAGAVKLYSNEACTTEVGANATSTLTVYAKGISAGSATVTVTSSADDTKSERCEVTVNAAEYSVTITAGSNMTKTTESGAESQTGMSGAMTDVVYTADEGYYFPENYSVTAVNGISVTRNSYTQITVSGTPIADAAITLTAPTAKTTPATPTTAAATDCTTADNNDGKLTGVTTAMEYKKSDATVWTAGTGSDITGLVPGTYYVRVKATDTTNASANQELTVTGFISYTVTFKVVNGKWNDKTTTDSCQAAVCPLCSHIRTDGYLARQRT